MLSQRFSIVFLAAALGAVSASAGPMVYVVTGAQQFGTVNLQTGAFRQIGPNTPEGQTGLVPGLNGSLLTLTFAGNLDSIDPVTGLTTFIGATGLDDCTVPGISSCGPTSASVIGEFQGKYYATDFSNNLYSVNPLTGAATLIGPTGMPALPFTPLIPNPDGSFGFFDESLFTQGGNLYADFDAAIFDPSTFTATPVVPARLYQIDPITGAATALSFTDVGFGAITTVNGAAVGFNDLVGQIETIDLTNGSTTSLGSYDPAAGLVLGAAPTPEPASIFVSCIGLAAIVLGRRRRRAA